MLTFINSWTGNQYLIVYAMFGVVELVLQSGGSFALVGFGIKAATVLHERMVVSMANAKILFFDAYVNYEQLPKNLLIIILFSNPMGRIMNRFSRDQDMLDTGITERMYQFFAALVYLFPTLSLSST